MIALDTNVVVRFLVNDEAAQARRARALIEANSVFVPVTVLLETEWVLRGGYRLPRADVVRLLRALLGLPDLSTEDPQRIARAKSAALHRPIPVARSGVRFGVTMVPNAVASARPPT